MTNLRATARLSRLAYRAGIVAIVGVGMTVVAAPAYAANSTAQLKKQVLTITGNDASNQFVLRLRAGAPDVLEVDVADDGTADFSFPLTAVSQIVVQAGGGDDLIRIDESNGAFTPSVPTTISGEAGDDTIIGGSGSESIKGGNGDDTITAGRGNDTDVRGGPGADTFTWSPGDGSDVLDGEGGTDTLAFTSGNVTERIAVATVGTGLRLTRDIANIQMDLKDLEALHITTLGGDDTIDASAVTAGSASIAINGGADDDTIIGSAGDDVIVGGPGADAAFLGAGNDSFVWSPGDGSDVVEGQVGNDTLVFNGANVSERIDLSANGQRLRLTRDVASITTDLDGVETVDLTMRGGSDRIAVNDLFGTDVKTVAIDLAGSDGTAGDGVADIVTVAGTLGADVVTVSGNAAKGTVAGLAATVAIAHAEGADDELHVNTFGGADSVDASGLTPGVIQLFVDGGADDDTLVGSAGDDSIVGGRGVDIALLGAGNDTFVWNPGDGNDVVEGQSGNDTLEFNGANVSEHIALAANGQRVRLSRDIANIVMDLDDVETIDVIARGGADVVTVGDLNGTDAKTVAIDLAGSDGTTGDGASDVVIVEGTAGDDLVTVTGSAGNAAVAGLAATVTIAQAEAANDQLQVNTFAGNDTVDASGLAAGVIQLYVDGVMI